MEPIDWGSIDWDSGDAGKPGHLGTVPAAPAQLPSGFAASVATSAASVGPAVPIQQPEPQPEHYPQASEKATYVGMVGGSGVGVSAITEGVPQTASTQSKSALVQEKADEVAQLGSGLAQSQPTSVKPALIPAVQQCSRSFSTLQSRFCEPADRFEHKKFRAFSDSHYKRLIESLPASTDWRVQLGYDIDAGGPPEDPVRRELQARGRVQHARLLSQRRLDELAVLVWTMDKRLNLPEVFNDVNEALLIDDPQQLTVFSGFIGAINRYISLHPTSRTVSLFRGTKIRDVQRVDPVEYVGNRDAVFRQPLYAAGTEDQAIAAEFASDGSPIIEYLVPVGCNRCAELPPDISVYPEEKEWLIMPYTGLRFVQQQEREFPPHGIDLRAGVERKLRLIVTFALVDEADVPANAPSHLMMCKESSLFRGGAAISVVGREAGAPVYGRALVIGIQSYAGDNRLANTLHDATDVAARLKEIGFAVTLLTDETAEAGLVCQLQMIDAITQFVESVDENTVAVFAFMGHGQEKNGMHFMMPQEMPEPKYLEQRAIGQKETLDRIQAKSPVLTMAILDCCRERVTGTRGVLTASKGLSGLKGPAGSLVMYATGEGGYAKDYSAPGSRNSVFTESLLEHLGTPGLDLDKLRKHVTKSVMQKTKGVQRPESHDSTEETIILVAGPEDENGGAHAQAASANALERTSASADELRAQVADAQVARLAAEAEVVAAKSDTNSERRTREQRSRSRPSGLPPNWEERVDATSGRMYYINHVSQTTQWEHPVELPGESDINAAPRQADAHALAGTYTVELPKSSGGFGIKIGDTPSPSTAVPGASDAVVTGFTHTRPQHAGVVVGSVIISVAGLPVSGQGRAGVIAALKHPQYGANPMSQSVSFEFRLPTKSSEVVSPQVDSVVHQEVYDFLAAAQLASHYEAVVHLGATCVKDLAELSVADLSGLGMKKLEVNRFRRRLTVTTLTDMGFSEADAQAALEVTESPEAAADWLLQGGGATTGKSRLQQDLERGAAGGAVGVLVEVQVPPGMRPGETMTVQAPDGRQMIVQIPTGAVSGARLQVSFPAAAGPPASTRSLMAELQTTTPTRVVEIMRAAPADEALQAHACRALMDALKQPSNRQVVAAAGGIDVVLTAMRNYPGATDVQAAGCTALVHLAVKNQPNQKVIVAGGGIDAVLAAMRSHPGAEDVQEWGCATLAQLANSEATENAVQVVASGGIDAVMAAMCNHLGAQQVQTWGCAALARLADSNQPNQQLVAAAGGIDAVLAAMRSHPGVEELQAFGCQALAFVAMTIVANQANTVNQQAIVASGGIGVVLAAMRKYPGAEELQRWGCAAFAYLAVKNQSNQQLVAAAGGIAVVLAAMRNHPGAMYVQGKGCAALAYLAVKNQPNQKVIVAGGGIDAVLAAMRSHPGAEDVQECGCATLAELAIKNQPNQQLVAAAGGIDAVLAAMRNHPGAMYVQEKGCAALAQLAHNDQPNQQAIVASGGIAVVLAAMRNHPGAMWVQGKGCGALAYLADNNQPNQQAIVASGGIGVVLAAMRNHPGAMLVQEEGCAALAYLADNNQPNQQAIVASGGIDAVLAAMRNHPGGEDAQEGFSQVLKKINPTSKR